MSDFLGGEGVKQTIDDIQSVDNSDKIFSFQLKNVTIVMAFPHLSTFIHTISMFLDYITKH